MKIIIRQFNQQVEVDVDDCITSEEITSTVFSIRQALIAACPDMLDTNSETFSPASDKQKNWCKALGYKGNLDELSYDMANSYIKEHKKY